MSELKKVLTESQVRSILGPWMTVKFIGSMGDQNIVNLNPKTQKYQDGLKVTDYIKNI